MSTAELALRLVAWAICTAFVLALAASAQRLLPMARPALRAATFLLLTIFVATLFLFLAGLLGGLSAGPLAAVGALGLGLMATVRAWRQALLGLPSELRRLLADLRAWWAELPRWLQVFTAAAMVISVLRFGFLIWALPPFVWDALTYHLTNVAHWTQAGRVELFDTPILRIYTPANYEVLAAWFTVFLHHDAVVEAAGLPAYALAILATYSLARSLGCSRPAAWMGAMAYASTPALLLATTGTKNDPHVAAYFLFALALLADLAETRPERDSGRTLSSWIVLAVTLLLAAGTKAYIAHLTPGLAVAAVLLPGVRRALPHWRTRLGEAARGWRGLGARSRWSLALVVLGALLLGGYWNARNWVLTGNPFYPYGVTIQGARLFTAADRTARLNLTRLVDNLASLAEKFGDAGGPIEPDLPETTGWGWFLYGLGLPALVWACFTRPRFRPLALGFLISLLVLMLSIRPSPFNMRYLIWLPAVAGLGYACWHDQLPSRPGAIPVLVGALFCGSLALNVSMTLNYNRVSLGRFGLMLERPLWERETALLKLNMPSEYEHAILFAPIDQVLGYNVGSDGFVYPLYRADYRQRLVYVPIGEREQCESIAVDMRERGTSFLFVAEGHTPAPVLQRVRDCARSGVALAEKSKGLYVIPSIP
jgi:hypothetical protein